MRLVRRYTLIGALIVICVVLLAIKKCSLLGKTKQELETEAHTRRNIQLPTSSTQYIETDISFRRGLINQQSFSDLRHLSRFKVDGILFANEPKDKNGHALSLLESITDFAAFFGGSLLESESLKFSQLVEGKKFVHDWLFSLQFPRNCKTSRKLNCNIFKNCGVGCQIHHLIYCFSVSIALNRTMVFEYNLSNWDSSIDWSALFLPVSNCTVRDYQSQPHPWSVSTPDSPVVDLPLIEALDPRPDYLPLAVPRTVYEKIKCCHLKPYVWWIGQLASFIMRPNHYMIKLVRQSKRRLGLEGVQYLGCHIRRTDKIGSEAKYHNVYEYYTALADAHQTLRSSQIFRNISSVVYLATDDLAAIEEFQTDFKAFRVAANEESTKSAAVMERKKKQSTANAVVDLYLLSQSHFIVCTFSSQFCRLAYELMQARDAVDRSWSAESLDDLYYFGGQSEHLWEALANHTSHAGDQISLQTGDKLKVKGNFRNGYWKGENLRTNAEGLFPAYKVKEVFKTFDDGKR